MTIDVHLRQLIAFASVFAAGTPVLAQSSEARALQPATVNLERLRQTPGPPWRRGHSPHFIVYREQPVSPQSLQATVDSLEVAWASATKLLDRSLPETPRAYVFVTSSRTRFAGFVPPEAKGLTTRLRDGDDVMFLVQNDSVRVYARHEVMHLVSIRAWGAPGPSRAWLTEGLATFADGQCQTSTVLAAARELLAARPTVRIQDVTDNFVTMWQTERAAAYVLAGSLVDYAWASRGRDGVHRLWSGQDSLVDAGVLPGAGGEQTGAWRAHVVKGAGGARGVSAPAFARAGCG